MLFAQLLYGTGLRLTKGLQLRVKDVDFAHNAIVVGEGKGGKGGKDRIVMPPRALVASLRAQVARSHDLWLGDQAEGRGGIKMPNALDRKYPRAGSSWACFRVLPQATHSTDPRSGGVRRHHLYDQTFQPALKKAVVASAITKPHTPHPSACATALATT